MKKLLIIPFIILLIIPFSISTNVECENAVNFIIELSDDVVDFKEGIGDLDGDGDNDIALGELLSDKYQWFENDGNGNFINHTLSGTYNNPHQAVITDIDKDGDNDIIGRYTSSVAVFKNDGSGTFTASTFSVDSDPTGMVAVDLNQDGEIDIAIVSVTTDTLKVYTNDGSETFTLAATVSVTDANFMRAIDVDGDNDYDLLIANYITGWVRWYENNGILGFTAHTLSDNIDAFDIAGADFDGDGDIDVVSGNYNDKTELQLQWYENDGNEVFTKHNISYVDETRIIIAINMDNDDDIDIVSGDITSNTLTIWENDGFGTFTGNNITDNFDPSSLSIADINGDDVLDIVFMDLVSDRLGFVDGGDCQGYPTRSQFIECEFPSLFCDDFNYGNPMSENDWIIQLGGGVVNNSFVPIDDKLRLQNTQNIFPYHETEAFETSYRPDSGSRFTRHIHSPLFSSEFYLNMTNQTDNQFFYTAMEKQNIIAYTLKAEVSDIGNSSGNMNWYYLNETQPSAVWKLICANCTTTEEETFIKINSLFANRPEFPFNSSIDDDEIHLYADYELIGVIEDYLDTRTLYISQYEFGKLSDGNYTIDDYYVMVGTDTETSTFEQYYEDFYTDVDVINETLEIGIEGVGDMAAFLPDIWDAFGLKSTASRMMTGLFLMFLLAIVMFGASISRGIQASATITIVAELFFMILLTYIRLLPIWLPFVIVLIAAGIGALVIKLSTG